MATCMVATLGKEFCSLNQKKFGQLISSDLEAEAFMNCKSMKRSNLQRTCYSNVFLKGGQVLGV